MSLNKNVRSTLNENYNSYNNIRSLCKDLIMVNNFSFKKILTGFILFLIILLGFLYLMPKIVFSNIFNSMIEFNLTISVSLVGLLIASFSIIMACFNRNSLYSLILSQDDKKKISSFKVTVLRCIEPLVWFSFLIFLSLGMKLSYLIYRNIGITLNCTALIKSIIASCLLYSIFISFKSLITFILNMTNLIYAYAKFEIQDRVIKSKGLPDDILVTELEKDLNNS
ncbi:hypothetical protein [Clostridium culturomicium]|uniref:hypothetical protein n=1 Tax=Clostridium culturomicium TaxID=1499683 RepID=UPI0005902455|nr:hypothetical protein [Clostridium culturomicium]